MRNSKCFQETFLVVSLRNSKKQRRDQKAFSYELQKAPTNIQCKVRRYLLLQNILDFFLDSRRFGYGNTHEFCNVHFQNLGVVLDYLRPFGKKIFLGRIVQAFLLPT